jgi:two-component system response regulator RegX3
MPLTVLLVANDKATTTTYANCFNKKEFSTLAAHSGRQALKEAKSHPLDAIVVDMTSPRLNCKTLCRKLKSASFAPLVLITLPNAKIDNALDPAGVVPKPAVAKRLAARTKAAIDNKPPRLLTIGKLALDLEKHKLTRGSKTFPLTPKEFGLLKTLMEHAGELVTRKVLMRQVWETDYMGDTRTLDVHIRWLREKVEDDPGEPTRVTTVRGQGYQLVDK